MLFALNDALKKTTKNKLWTDSLLLSTLDEFLKSHILSQYGEPCEDMKINFTFNQDVLDIRLKCANAGLLTCLKLDQHSLATGIQQTLSGVAGIPRFESINLNFYLK
jgi:hypothetical protein